MTSITTQTRATTEPSSFFGIPFSQPIGGTIATLRRKRKWKRSKNKCGNCALFVGRDPECCSGLGKYGLISRSARIK
jgi:hypothetical protein